jgi:hypothetical protein
MFEVLLGDGGVSLVRREGCLELFELRVHSDCEIYILQEEREKREGRGRKERKK